MGYGSSAVSASSSSAGASISGLYLDDNYHLYYPAGMKMTDGIPADVMEVVNDHWSQFPPANPLIAHFFGIMFFFLWIVSFLGNGCVVYIFLKVKGLRTPTNMFVVNLAVADLLMMTTMGPTVTVNVFLQRYWVWGAFGCKLYGFAGAVCGCVAILNMVVIGYDRYNVIVKGLSGTKITPGKAACILFAIWGYCIAIALPPLNGVWGGYTTEGLLYTCSYDYLSDTWSAKSYVLFGFFFNYLVPMVMIFFFYSSIVKAVWAHEHALREQARKMNVESLRSNAAQSAETAEVRIAKVAVTNVSLWATIWTPYALVVLTAVIGSKASITPLTSQIPSFFAKTASCLNPVVYAMSHPKYREALTKELPCLGVEEHPQDYESGTVKESVKAEKA